MILVELVKMLRRPRTWVTLALLNALPTLVAVLLAVTRNVAFLGHAVFCWSAFSIGPGRRLP